MLPSCSVPMSITFGIRLLEEIGMGYLLSSKFWLRELSDSRGVRPTHINTLPSNVIGIEELYRDRKEVSLGAEVKPIM